MEKINLFYLAKPPYGGWVTYTAHMVKAFRELGHEARVVKKGNKTENKTRPFLLGEVYQNINPDMFTALKGINIIVAVDKHHYEYLFKVKNGSILVVHDPTEISEELQEIIKRKRFKLVTIREANVRTIENRLRQKPVFIKHPYVPVFEEVPEKTKCAVCVSRIDWDKNTHVIAAANEKTKNPADIYGAINRLYEFHKIVKEAPEWRKHYKGGFPKEINGADLCKDYRYMIDLSVIKGDGGGTQYSFLEAIDASSVLILHKDWIIEGSIFENAKNCLVVSNASQLAELLNRDLELDHMAKQAREILKDHVPEATAAKYLEI